MKMKTTLFLVLFILSSYFVFADTTFNETFEDNDCSNWVSGCTVRNTAVINGTYSGEHTAQHFRSPVITMPNGGNSAYNLTFWAKLPAPAGGSYNVISFVASGGAWDTGLGLYFENGAGNCPASDDNFCDYRAGTYSDTGVPFCNNVVCKYTIEFNTTTTSYNLYINDTIRARNLAFRGGAVNKNTFNQLEVNQFTAGNRWDDISVWNATQIPLAVSIIYPNSTDRNNVQLNTSFSVLSSSALNSNVTLFINGTANATVLNVPSGGNRNLTTVGLSNAHYSWIVQACDSSAYCVNSTTGLYIFDNINPTITWNSPSTVQNFSTQNLSASISVADANLYRVNFTVYNSSGYPIYNNFSGDMLTTAYSLTPKVNFTKEDNYTITVDATDSHTYGSLNGLTYGIDAQGITFQKGLVSKRIYFGYYTTTFNFLNSSVIQNYNISSNIADNGKGEYEFHLNYRKPATSVKFGFALPFNENLKLIDPSIGHFVWNNGMSGWYFDFADLVTAGYTLTYTTKNVGGTDYHVIYTNTNECSSAVGEMCQI